MDVIISMIQRLIIICLHVFPYRKHVIFVGKSMLINTNDYNSFTLYLFYPIISERLSVMGLHILINFLHPSISLSYLSTKIILLLENSHVTIVNWRDLFVHTNNQLNAEVHYQTDVWYTKVIFLYFTCFI